MPSASILTMTSDRVVSSTGAGAATVDVVWDVETKYLDGAFDFFDSGVSTKNLVIPPAMNGGTFEVFLWFEPTEDIYSTSAGSYIGLLSSSIPGWDQWWGIYNETGKASRGCRTGPLIADNAGGYFHSQVREFSSNNITTDASFCRLGVIQGAPDFVAAASAHEVGYAAPVGTSTLTLKEDIDIGGVYSNGTYTAPVGAELAVVTANGGITSAFGAPDFIWELFKNGSRICEFRHGGSGLGFGPGTFGLVDVVAGDTLEVRVDNLDASPRTGTFHTAVEFY